MLDFSQLVNKFQRDNMAERMMEDVMEDYYLEEIMPKVLKPHHHSLIEYRIKLLIKEDVVFQAGESQLVNTCCLLKGKNRIRLSMFLSPNECVPLTFESGGYIDHKYAGRVMLKLTNYSNKKINVKAGAILAYISMQPFSME